MSRFRPLVLSAFTLVALAGCGGSSEGGSAPAARGPLRFPVEVETVESAPVEYAVRAVGSVEAFEEVAATARVPGVIERVRFQEGDSVGPEDVLAEVEPGRYRLSLDASKADFAKATAERDEARLGLERREAVNRKNPDLVRAEEVDAWRTRLAAAEAEVARAASAVSLAELNLRDAYVKAPVAGVVQSRQVETGRYVQAGTVVATLLRREPLLLRFRVPELDAAPLVPGQPLRFSLRGGRDKVYSAELSLVAAAADSRDRMVDVTARVDDPDRGELRPGAFAEITIPVGSDSAAPVIPQTAIRPSERGFLAFVIEDGVAHERVLELGLRTGDGRVEVRSGLVAGERLVVRGGEALQDGSPVAEAGA